MERRRLSIKSVLKQNKARKQNGTVWLNEEHQETDEERRRCNLLQHSSASLTFELKLPGDSTPNQRRLSLAGNQLHVDDSRSLD